MKKETISEIISQIDEKYTDEATEFAANGGGESAAVKTGPALRARRARRLLWAACVALLVIAASVATAFAAEAAEYKKAVSFFEENRLSANGLSRSEIKAVYRDITTRSFTYEKTATVLRSYVPGWEIEQEEPTPEELAAIWDKNVWMKKISNTGISYRTACLYVADVKRGIDVFEKSVVECYRDGKLIYTAEFRDFYAEGCGKIKDGTVVWGINADYLSDNPMSCGWIALVDDSGEIKWQRRLTHGFKHESVVKVLDNGDGTLAAIGRGDQRYLCLSFVDADGKELSFSKTDAGGLGIRNAARLGDGYLVQLYSTVDKETALLYKLDREGNLTDSFSYGDDESDYYITDMAEFGGQIYISAYAVPKQNDLGARHEIGNILDYIFSKGEEGYNIDSGELTPLVRDNYTALLLKCDPEGGMPSTFYSV
ncbi:MAG: hypothetical protein J6V01_05500, partial [Clostridia bacterium]|nr:hypothetical protein [Clostridia bacterium]